MVEQGVVNAHRTRCSKVFRVIDLHSDILLQLFVNLYIDRHFGPFLLQGLDVGVHLIGLKIKVHKVVLLTEVFQFGFGLFQRILDAKQFIVNEKDGVFRNHILLFQATADIFVHQQIDEFHNLQSVAALHAHRNDRGLLGEGTNAEGTRLPDERRITIEPEVQLSVHIRLWSKQFRFGDADAVVAVVNPITFLIFATNIDLGERIVFCHLAKDIIVHVEAFAHGVKPDVAVFEEGDFVGQSNGLRHTMLKLDEERSAFVQLSVGDSAFLQIGHFDAHLLDGTLAQGIRSQDGNFVVQVLGGTIGRISHNGCRVKTGTVVLDDDRTRGLIYLGRIAVDNKADGQGHYYKYDEQIPMIQEVEYHLSHIDDWFFFDHLFP